MEMIISSRYTEAIFYIVEFTVRLQNKENGMKQWVYRSICYTKCWNNFNYIHCIGNSNLDDSAVVEEIRTLI